MIYVNSIDATTFEMYGDRPALERESFPKDYEALSVLVAGEDEPRVSVVHKNLGYPLFKLVKCTDITIDSVAFTTAKDAVIAFNAAVSVGGAGTVTVTGMSTAVKQDTQILNQALYADSVFTLTRPANTTVYSDGDAILDVVGIATQKFAGVAKAAGRGVNFINLTAFTNDTGLAGKTINVSFYKSSPASPIADNSAFSYSLANATINKGVIPLVFGTTISAGVAQVGIESSGGMTNLELCPTATDVFVQVWLPVGYTPSGNSTYIIFKASVIQN